MESSKPKFIFVTTQPSVIEDALKGFPFSKAIKLFDFECVALRDFGFGKHHTIDGRPAGGGDGMILRVDTVHKAIQHAKSLTRNPFVIGLCPKGELVTQNKIVELSREEKDFIFVCGRFGGFDHRCYACLLYTSPSPRDKRQSRMPSSA